MLHLWTIAMLALCAALAAVSLLRGLAGLAVARTTLGRLEAAALLLAGLGGLFVMALSRHIPG